MKPDSNLPGVPFNFDTVPLWLKPDLWDETKTVRCRGLLFILLYILSAAAFGGIIAVPVGIYMGVDTMGTTALVCLAVSLPGGVLLGLGTWWDFTRASRRLAVEAASMAQAKESSDNSVDGKE